MIPRTKNGLSAMACLSAMQKCIRRGMEKEAMQFACELLHTSKNFHTMVCNRLEIISHEDIDTGADPRIVPFVKAAMDQARAWRSATPSASCRVHRRAARATTSTWRSG
jgi:replication-associated recombination protein RarA